jgi:RNA polymerase sigma-70 factor (ECF subfamily)
MTPERTDKHFLEHLQRHQNILHKICFAYCKTATDREDLQQEIVLQLWKAYPSFRGKSQFSTWMYRVALNTAINKTSKAGFLADSSSYTDPFYDPEEGYELSEEIRMLHRAIAQLRKVEKAIILLWLEELSYREIAETIGITEKNVSVKIVRAKARLAEIIKKLH